MRSREQILMEKAYDEVNEGIWGRLKGQGAGIASGLKQGAQNLAVGAANKLGAGITPSGKSMGQAYAQSQQKSIFKTFITNTDKLVADFMSDIKKMSAGPASASFPGGSTETELTKMHPQIKQKLQQIAQLKRLLLKKQQETGLK